MNIHKPTKHTEEETHEDILTIHIQKEETNEHTQTNKTQRKR